MGNKKTKPDFREQNKERIYIIDMPCPRGQNKQPKKEGNNQEM